MRRGIRAAFPLRRPCRLLARCPSRGEARPSARRRGYAERRLGTRAQNRYLTHRVNASIATISWSLASGVTESAPRKQALALSDQAQLQQVSLHEPLDCCPSRLDDLEGCYEQSCIMIDRGI